MAPRLCSINIDLDEAYNYFAIHGKTAETRATPIYDDGVPAFLNLASAFSVPLTFFVVGQDLKNSHVNERIKLAHRRGHAIGNHSYSHLYNLTQQPREVIAREIDMACEAIQQTIGCRPRGFRAPGYTVTDETLAMVKAFGHAYDSSVFPCPAYMLAKDAAILNYKLRGSPSRSIMDSPLVLTAPVVPYRIGAPYYRQGQGLLELPIQVTRGFRLPYIGTTLMLAGPLGARALTRMVIGSELINLELHGIDLLDSSHAALAPLEAHQPDLRVSKARKTETLESVILFLKQQKYTFVTLDEASEYFAKKQTRHP